MKVLTAKEMREADRYAIEEIGIPSIVLMENAKNAIMKHVPEEGRQYQVVVSTGNNGGDGLAVARDLLLQEKNVEVFLLGYPEKASGEFKINYRIYSNLMGKITKINDITLLNLGSVEKEDVIIDGIFGTGLERDIEGLYRKAIEKINGGNAFILSIDIPSGIDTDDGSVHGIAVEADRIVALQCLKKGHLKIKGEIFVEDIGIPEIAVEHALSDLV